VVKFAPIAAHYRLAKGDEDWRTIVANDKSELSENSSSGAEIYFAWIKGHAARWRYFCRCVAIAAAALPLAVAHSGLAAPANRRMYPGRFLFQ
jgi:hypothetical protein